MRSPLPLAGAECCPHCGRRVTNIKLKDYACPRCGRLLDDLYRREHHDPALGARLSAADILREYQIVGMTPPGWLP